MRVNHFSGRARISLGSWDLFAAILAQTFLSHLCAPQPRILGTRVRATTEILSISFPLSLAMSTSEVERVILGRVEAEGSPNAEADAVEHRSGNVTLHGISIDAGLDPTVSERLWDFLDLNPSKEMGGRACPLKVASMIPTSALDKALDKFHEDPESSLGVIGTVAMIFEQIRDLVKPPKVEAPSQPPGGERRARHIQPDQDESRP